MRVTCRVSLWCGFNVRAVFSPFSAVSLRVDNDSDINFTFPSVDSQYISLSSTYRQECLVCLHLPQFLLEPEEETDIQEVDAAGNLTFTMASEPKRGNVQRLCVSECPSPAVGFLNFQLLSDERFRIRRSAPFFGFWRRPKAALPQPRDGGRDRAWGRLFIFWQWADNLDAPA